MSSLVSTFRQLSKTPLPPGLAVAALIFSSVLLVTLWGFEPSFVFVPFELVFEVSGYDADYFLEILATVIFSAIPSALLVVACLAKGEKAKLGFLLGSLFVAFVFDLFPMFSGTIIQAGSGSALLDFIALIPFVVCAVLFIQARKDTAVVALVSTAILVAFSLILFLAGLDPFAYEGWSTDRYLSVFLSSVLRWLVAALIVCGLHTDAGVESVSSCDFAGKTERKNTLRAVVMTKASISDACAEIAKFKELLDMGAITQEEFDAKKKELLGL